MSRSNTPQEAGDAHDICTHVLRDRPNFADLELLGDYGAAAAAEERYAAAEELLSDALRFIDNCGWLYLLKRSAVRHIQGNTEGALADARQVMQYKPINADSYLMAGHILLQQNRVDEALETYRTGRDQADEGDDRYFELWSRAEALERFIKEQNGRITHALPFDILFHIFDMLPVSTHLQLAATCTDWRHLLLTEWPDMWRSVELDAAALRDYASVKPFVSRIPGEHVREIKFALRDKHVMRKTLQAIVYSNWNKLESLEFTAQLAGLQIMQSLIKMNKHTLRHIRFRDIPGHFESSRLLWLHDILRTHTGLRTFECDIHTIDALLPDSRLSGASQQARPLHTALNIRILSVTTTTLAPKLPHLLKYCSHLEELTINPAIHAYYKGWMRQLVDTLDYHCRKLRRLSFRTWPERSDSSTDQNQLALADGDHPTGLQELYYHVPRMAIPWRSLGQLIEKHGRTLRSFHFKAIHYPAGSQDNDGGTEHDHTTHSSNSVGNRRANDARCLMRLSSVPAHHLRQLKLILGTGETPSLLSATELSIIIRELPALESIHLRAQGVNHQSVLEALGNLQLLRQLDIGTVNWRECSIQGLSTLFSNRARTLINLNMSGEVDDQILCATQHCSVLQRLSFEDKQHRVSTHGVASFAANMRKSQLTHISIQAATRYIDFLDMMPLAQLPRLCRLEVFDYNAVASHSTCPTFAPVFQFIQASPNALRLTVLAHMQATYYKISKVLRTDGRRQFRVEACRMLSEASSIEYYDYF